MTVNPTMACSFSFCNPRTPPHRLSHVVCVQGDQPPNQVQSLSSSKARVHLLSSPSNAKVTQCAKHMKLVQHLGPRKLVPHVQTHKRLKRTLVLIGSTNSFSVFALISPPARLSIETETAFKTNADFDIVSK